MDLFYYYKGVIMDINTLKRIYDLTGKNVFFELDDPKNSDPLVLS